MNYLIGLRSEVGCVIEENQEDDLLVDSEVETGSPLSGGLLDELENLTCD